jgi:hypothetical protein
MLEGACSLLIYQECIACGPVRLWQFEPVVSPVPFVVLVVTPVPLYHHAGWHLLAVERCELLSTIMLRHVTIVRCIPITLSWQRHHSITHGASLQFLPRQLDALHHWSSPMMASRPSHHMVHKAPASSARQRPYTLYTHACHVTTLGCTRLHASFLGHICGNVAPF